MSADTELAYLLDKILFLGLEIDSRNAWTKRVTTQPVVFDKTPLVSLRKTAWKSALREFEWFLTGSSNINHLHESVQKWWKPWANEDGYVPYNYSKQFKFFQGSNGTIDQIETLITGLIDKPFSRRHVITTWNTSEMQDTPLTNCHGTVIQCFVDPDAVLHMTMYQRSCDMILGVPHNWIQYWAFLMFLAHRTGNKVGTFTSIGGDCHIYQEHCDIASDMVHARGQSNVPKLVYNPTSKDFKAEDFSLDGEYDPVITDTAKMIV